MTETTTTTPVDLLREQVVEAVRLTEALVGDLTDPEQMVALALLIDGWRRDLALIKDELINLMDDVWPGGGLTLSDGRVAQMKHSAKSVRWDSLEILKRLIAQALDERKRDEETGEILEREADVISRVLLECSPIGTPSHGWRKEPLRARGFDLDEFCEQRGWKASLVIE